MTESAMDTELICVEGCGAHMVVTFSDCLRTGWPTCCGVTMRVMHTDADIDAAVGDIVQPIAASVARRLQS